MLWGWIGKELRAEELQGVERFLKGLQGDLGHQQANLLTAEEITSLATRCARVVPD